MGYQILSERKQKAREAAGEASYTVGVLIAENYLAQYETFYWKMYQELAVAATEKRCFAAVEILRKEDERNTLKLPACVEGNKVDGLIVLGKINKEYIVKLTETARIPAARSRSPASSTARTPIRQSAPSTICCSSKKGYRSRRAVRSAPVRRLFCVHNFFTGPAVYTRRKGVYNVIICLHPGRTPNKRKEAASWSKIDPNPAARCRRPSAAGDTASASCATGRSFCSAAAR